MAYQISPAGGMAYALVLETRFSEFESRVGHQVKGQCRAGRKAVSKTVAFARVMVRFLHCPPGMIAREAMGRHDQESITD